MVPADWSKDVSLGPDESADMVVTFRNLHGRIEDAKADKVFRSFVPRAQAWRHLGHRTAPRQRGSQGRSQDHRDTGYVPEAYVIQLAEKAGFKLVAKSEINANPKDTKNHPEGVWTLPPSLRLGDKDREKYMAIGESDRMTLKLTKP